MWKNYVKKNDIYAHSGFTLVNIRAAVSYFLCHLGTDGMDAALRSESALNLYFL